MKIKLFFVSLLLGIISSNLIAQEGYNPPHYFEGPPGDDVFASPDVQAFHKYQILPEKLYTGKVDISIPLFIIQQGEINVPISLSYNTGGIKVSEVASNVGIGWSLNAGGSILKIVRDLSDDDFHGTGHSEANNDQGGSGSFEWILAQVGYHRKGYPNPYSYFNNPGWHHNTTGTGTLGKLDSSPDFFSVNAPGLNTKFYLEDANPSDNTTQFAGRTYDAVFLDHSGVKINHAIQRTTEIVPRFGTTVIPGTYTVNGTSFYNYNYIDFSSFEVLNTNGIKYSFENKDYSETTYRGYNNSSNRGLSSTNWNLTKITDPKSNKEVSFSYEEYFDPNKEITKSYTTSYQNPSSSFDENDFYYIDISNVSLNSGNYTINYTNDTANRSPKKHRISSISWDRGTVDFEYSLTRIDSPGEKALTRVVVKNMNGKIIKDFRLNYSYFNSKENCSEKECKRLKLDNVEDLTNTGAVEKKYEFTYHYGNPLPKRTSWQKDYLGFYNNNGFEWNGASTVNPPNPTLHFYKNQGIYSVLPFQRTNGSNYRLLNGSYSLLPNTYSFSGLLKKVTYPTGGSTELEYENHTFNFEGAEYTAGGARIKKQKLDDGSGNIQEILYEYKLANGNSSGYINAVPTFAHLNKPSALSGLPSRNAFTYYNKAKYSLELTEGAFVGYERVIKKQIDNGYVVTTFSSPNQFPNGRENTLTSNGNNNSDFLQNNNYPSLNIIDYDIRRGKMMSEKIYDESNTLLESTDYTHNYKVFSTVNLSYLTTIQGSPFVQGSESEFNHTSHFNIERNLQTEVVNTQYFSNGNKITETFTTYDPNYPFVKEQKIVTENEEVKTKLFYPYNSEVSSMPYASNLVTANRLYEPLKQETRVDNNLITTKQWNYHNFGNGIILPKTFLSAKGTQALEEKVTYHDYDSKGNPLEVSKTNGSKVYYVWGYDKTLPIAKIEGYSTISSTQQTKINEAITASNNDNSAGTEYTLRTKLEALRNSFSSQGALVTTYTYDPLKGVTSMTDSRGQIVFYYYDSFNRLEYVKDAYNNIISANQYNYKN